MFIIITISLCFYYARAFITNPKNVDKLKDSNSVDEQTTHESLFTVKVIITQVVV